MRTHHTWLRPHAHAPRIPLAAKRASSPAPADARPGRAPEVRRPRRPRFRKALRKRASRPHGPPLPLVPGAGVSSRRVARHCRSAGVERSKAPTGGIGRAAVAWRAQRVNEPRLGSLGAVRFGVGHRAVSGRIVARVRVRARRPRGLGSRGSRPATGAPRGRVEAQCLQLFWCAAGAYRCRIRGALEALELVKFDAFSDRISACLSEARTATMRPSKSARARSVTVSGSSSEVRSDAIGATTIRRPARRHSGSAKAFLRAGDASLTSGANVRPPLEFPRRQAPRTPGVGGAARRISNPSDAVERACSPASFRCRWVPRRAGGRGSSPGSKARAAVESGDRPSLPMARVSARAGAGEVLVDRGEVRRPRGGGVVQAKDAGEETLGEPGWPVAAACGVPDRPGCP